MSADDRRDLTKITRAISALFAPGDVVELRALDVGGKTIAGYFDDHTKLVEAAAKQSGQARALREGKRLGRPAGSKDKQSRRTTGYHLRYANVELREKYGKYLSVKK